MKWYLESRIFTISHILKTLSVSNTAINRHHSKLRIDGPDVLNIK